MAMGAISDHWYYPGGSFYGGVGAKTKSGSAVSEFNAMQLAVVWACVRILSEDTASLPLHLYRRLSTGGKERAINHPLYSLLHDRPNPEMTALTFREVYAAHLVSWGNGYAEKQFGSGRIGKNQIEALWPITPNRVTVRRNSSKQIEYKINFDRTSAAAISDPVVLPKRNILHTPGLGFNGLVGYSPIGMLREAIGLGKSLEEYGELYFGQGTHPGVIVSHPGKLDATAHSNLKTSLADAHSGLGKSHRLMLLEDGMKIEKIGIENKDAQFLESKKYSNIEIGTRIYRLPPQMYGEYDKASTYASAEQFDLDYHKHTLRAWLVRLEQAYNTLLDPSEQGEYFFEHNVEGLLRGDMKSRYEAHAIGRNNGWLNADEIREIENMNPMPDGQGKIYLVPLNMIPASEAGKTPEPASEPAQQPTEEKNRDIYRKRLENAYIRLISDAIGRVTRKESQRVNWILKNQGNNGALSEFYRDFPDYIKKQVFPVFLSFAESLTGMESELNGLKYDDFKAETQRFIDVFCSNFACDYVETSQNLTSNGGDWMEREATSIADTQTKSLADAYIKHLEALIGVRK
jgi:HK97 family phage portal protein